MRIIIDPNFERLMNQIRNAYSSKGIYLTNREVTRIIAKMLKASQLKKKKRKKKRKKEESFSIFNEIDGDIFHL